MKLSALADQATRNVERMGLVDEEMIRDECDFASKCELDSFQLDLLVSMVLKRVIKGRAQR